MLITISHTSTSHTAPCRSSEVFSRLWIYLGPQTTATIATTPKNTTPTTLQCISGFALPSVNHNKKPLLYVSFETSATALCGTTGTYLSEISKWSFDDVWVKPNLFLFLFFGVIVPLWLALLLRSPIARKDCHLKHGSADTMPRMTAHWFTLICRELE